MYEKWVPIKLTYSIQLLRVFGFWVSSSAKYSPKTSPERQFLSGGFFCELKLKLLLLQNHFSKMATVGEKSCLDIEAGPHRASAAGESDGSLCFSDADDASWHSPHDSNRNASPSEELLQRSGASNDEIDGVGELGRSPCCISESSFEVDLEKNEADCRICHLNLESKELGIPIVLGCSCRNDLAAAHKQCAETWFKVKGNKTCEICGSTAKNVGNPEHLNEAYSHIVASARPNETRRFWRGHRFLNLLLACLIFAFVVSWLFRFNT